MFGDGEDWEKERSRTATTPQRVSALGPMEDRVFRNTTSTFRHFCLRPEHVAYAHDRCIAVNEQDQQLTGGLGGERKRTELCSGYRYMLRYGHGQSSIEAH